MIRKYLFWGLTLVLVAAIFVLVIHGRRLEQRETGSSVEAVKESEATQTRVWAPPDMVIMQSKMRLNKSADGAQYLSARHEVEIRNNGKIPYTNIELRFTYLDGGAKVIETRYYVIKQIVQANTGLTSVDIEMDHLPASTTNCRTTLVYADMGTPAPIEARER
jgi:hypothetical protein